MGRNLKSSERLSSVDFPALLPLLPLRDIVVFPQMAVPLFVGRGKSIAAVNYAVKHGNLIMLTVQKDPTDEAPEKDGMHEIGCVGEIMQMSELPDGTMKIMVEGLSRAAITNFKADQLLFLVEARQFPSEMDAKDPEIEALARNVKLLFEKYAKMASHFSPDVPSMASEISDPNDLVNFTMRHIALKAPERQAVLAEPKTKKQLEAIFVVLEKELEIIQIENRVKGRVKRQMGQSQREYYLNEQIKAIQ